MPPRITFPAKFLLFTLTAELRNIFLDFLLLILCLLLLILTSHKSLIMSILYKCSLLYLCHHLSWCQSRQLHQVITVGEAYSLPSSDFGSRTFSGSFTKISGLANPRRLISSKFFGSFINAKNSSGSCPNLFLTCAGKFSNCS